MVAVFLQFNVQLGRCIAVVFLSWQIECILSIFIYELDIYMPEPLFQMLSPSTYPSHHAIFLCRIGQEQV